MKNKILKGIIEEGKPISIKNNPRDCREVPKPLRIFPSTKHLDNRLTKEQLQEIRIKMFGKEYDK